MFRAHGTERVPENLVAPRAAIDDTAHVTHSGQIGERGIQTRKRLIEAMLGLVNEGGMPVVASVRSIASRAGVTEAVLYRYFPTKDAMFREVWETTLAAMVEQKRLLLEGPPKDPADLLRAWTRITYQQFDQDPAAFHFVLLSEGTAVWREEALYSIQGELLGAWMKSTIHGDLLSPLDHETALHCVVDLLLAVPRRIRIGCTSGPALDHVESTMTAMTRVLGI